MKTILCYGDSLTWGFSPDGSGRHAYEDRWPSVLQEGLGGAALAQRLGIMGERSSCDKYPPATHPRDAGFRPALQSGPRCSA